MLEIKAVTDTINTYITICNLALPGGQNFEQTLIRWLQAEPLSLDNVEVLTDTVAYREELSNYVIANIARLRSISKARFSAGGVIHDFLKQYHYPLFRRLITLENAEASKSAKLRFSPIAPKTKMSTTNTILDLKTLKLTAANLPKSHQAPVYNGSAKVDSKAAKGKEPIKAPATMMNGTWAQIAGVFREPF